MILIQKVLNNLALLIGGISLFFYTNYIVFILSNRGGTEGEKAVMVKCMLIAGYTNTFSSIFGIGNQVDLSASPPLSLRWVCDLEQISYHS